MSMLNKIVYAWFWLLLHLKQKRSWFAVLSRLTVELNDLKIEKILVMMQKYLYQKKSKLK